MSKASAFDKHLANSLIAGHRALLQAWNDPSTVEPAIAHAMTVAKNVLAGVSKPVVALYVALMGVIAPDSKVMLFLAPHLKRLEEQYAEHVHPRVQEAHGLYMQHVQPRLDLVTAWYLDHIHPRLVPLMSDLQGMYSGASRYFERSLSDFSKLDVALMAMALIIVSYLVVSAVLSWWEHYRRTPLSQRLATFTKKLPFIKGLWEKEFNRALQGIQDDIKKKDVGAPASVVLPPVGMDAGTIIDELEARSVNDYHYADHRSQVTGAIYMTKHEHRELLHDAYCLFSQTNPIHADLFPSIRRLEAEVVAMTASLLGGGPEGNPEVCGCMTSGGSESILTAMFASFAYQRKNRGIKQPEILMANTAHAAYFKAASYSGAKLLLVKPDPESFALTASIVKRHLTANTAIVIVSAVTYPHGVIDEVAAIAALCRKRKVLVHCDACLGGFVLPFLRKLGHDVPPFDFSVPGVTSMSVDTHKYGQGHKGTSVLLYSSPELRRCQYTSVTEWAGGMYISPGMAGSRSGALIATAWAALRHLGEAGYVKATSETMAAAQQFKACVESVPELAVCGQPAMCLIAFRSRARNFDIHVLSDLMNERGWQMSALIKPAAVHFCFTHQHADIGPEICKDLLKCCAEVRRKAAAGDKMSAKARLYGMTNSLPDRDGLGDLLYAYQDVLLTP